MACPSSSDRGTASIADRAGRSLEADTKHSHGMAYAISACVAVHEATGEPGALAIAEKRRTLRPHLDYSADREAEMPVSLASIRPSRTPTACG